jgi:hypothetical protein
MRWLAVGVAGLLGACGGPAVDGAATFRSGGAEPSDCVISPESTLAIVDGLTVPGGGRLRTACAVPVTGSDDFAFVVAAEIDGPGMEGDGEIGTWAVGVLGGGPIVAVNSTAREFSAWGSAVEEGSPMDVARDAIARSPQAQAAEDCASG